MEVKHASEIQEIFDAISYKKGASVIRMLQNYIGAESFQVGDLIYSLYLYELRCCSALKQLLVLF